VLLAVMAVGLVLAWIIPALFGVSAEVVIVVAALAVGLLGAGVVLLRGRRREGGSA
jgi:hypothetical protein